MRVTFIRYSYAHSLDKDYYYSRDLSSFFKKPLAKLLWKPQHKQAERSFLLLLVHCCKWLIDLWRMSRATTKNTIDLLIATVMYCTPQLLALKTHFSVLSSCRDNQSMSSRSRSTSCPRYTTLQVACLQKVPPFLTTLNLHDGTKSPCLPASAQTESSPILFCYPYGYHTIDIEHCTRSQNVKITKAKMHIHSMRIVHYHLLLPSCWNA